ncbi:MAG TPA: hypothetical protein VF510_07935 [Ktedonobacterales bacterium]
MEQPRPRLRLVVAALCVVVVLFACSTPTAVRLSTAPADKLGLTLTITHLLTPSAQVIVDAVLRSSSGNPVELTGKQHLTVNGRNEDSSPLGGILGHSASRFTVPRASAGGEYTVVYTDERGQQTSVVVPAPQRDLTITSPTAHAQIPIPQPGGQVAVQYTDPSLFPRTSPLSRPPSMQVDAGAEGHCRVARRDGISASAPSCISFITSQPDETGNAVISDKNGLPEYGFGNLAPGPGLLYARVDVYGNLPPAGFASVLMSSTDIASIPITWV